MNKHLSSASLKLQAKGQLLGKYSTVVGATAIYAICSIFLSFNANVLINTSTLHGILFHQTASYLIRLLVGMLSFGLSYIYLKLCCNQPIFVKDIFYGFSYNPNRILGIEAVIGGISLVCMLPANLFTLVRQGNPDNYYLILIEGILLVVGAVIMIYFQLIFSQSHYLLLDFPQYSPREILYISRKIMHGNKGRLFYIYLSFVPLYLLCTIGYYIPLLWVYPYLQAVLANFYMDIVKKYNQTKA